VKFLKHIRLTLGHLGQHLRSLPRFLAQAGEQRKQRLARNENEAERLDRIRHPEKYRGK
jgi:hypothetical protein